MDVAAYDEILFERQNMMINGFFSDTFYMLVAECEFAIKGSAFNSDKDKDSRSFAYHGNFSIFSNPFYCFDSVYECGNRI